MSFFGNIFTHYNYTTIDVKQTAQNGIANIRSNKSNFNVTFENSSSVDIPLPDGSPFTDWKEARKFAGPLPFTFTYNTTKKEVLIIEGVRENWRPEPVKIVDFSFEFIDSLKLDEIIFANAFHIKNIPYCWKKGKIEAWTR